MAALGYDAKQLPLRMCSTMPFMRWAARVKPRGRALQAALIAWLTGVWAGALLGFSGSKHCCCITRHSARALSPAPHCTSGLQEHAHISKPG